MARPKCAIVLLHLKAFLRKLNLRVKVKMWGEGRGIVTKFDGTKILTVTLLTEGALDCRLLTRSGTNR